MNKSRYHYKTIRYLKVEGPNEEKAQVMKKIKKDGFVPITIEEAKLPPDGSGIIHADPNRFKITAERKVEKIALDPQFDGRDRFLNHRVVTYICPNCRHNAIRKSHAFCPICGDQIRWKGM